MGLFGVRWFGARRGAPPAIRVQVTIKGRVGDGWFDVDRTLRVAPGTTLRQLIDLADRRGVPLRQAIDQSPHLRETLMWNGERCPVDQHGDRALADGDQVYLLAPIAGG